MRANWAVGRFRRTGQIDHWPIYIANLALAFFAFGLLITVLEALGF
jgi:hypothetical protein